MQFTGVIVIPKVQFVNALYDSSKCLNILYFYKLDDA